MEKIEVKAETRQITGRKVKSLRRQNILPAVVYGHDFKPISIQIPLKEFQRVYSEAGESTLVYLEVDGRNYPAIIHDVSRNPVSDDFLHADFYKVRLDETVDADIPLIFVGEAPAVKNLGGVLIKNISELKVEGFPQNLPHNIEIDISSLADLNGHINVKDLKIGDKVKIKANPEDIIVLVQEPISEEELKAQFETGAPAAEEVEVIKKEKAEEEKIEPETTEEIKT